MRDAPRIDVDGHLSPAEEQELYCYYGLEYSPMPAPPPAVGTPVRTDRADSDQVAGPLDPPEAQRDVASAPDAEPLLRRSTA